MKIENQVCTLKQAKRIAELGVSGVPMLWWRNDFPSNQMKYKNKWYIENEYPYTGKAQNVKFGTSHHLIAAFTVAELGVMLPTLGFEFCKSNNGSGEDFFWLTGSYWKISGVVIENKYEAQARAEMLIYLLEQKLTTPEEVNNRLTTQ
jgi:hypothetical protein